MNELRPLLRRLLDEEVPGRAARAEDLRRLTARRAPRALWLVPATAALAFVGLMLFEASEPSTAYEAPSLYLHLQLSGAPPEDALELELSSQRSAP